MSTDLTIADFNYRVGKLNPLTQLNIARRLAPALAAVGLRAADLQGKQNVALGEFLEPIAQIAAKMTDEDVEYIIFTCLSVVQRQQADGRYQGVANLQARSLQFQDIDLPVMMRLAAAVVQENLGGFFALLPGLTSSPTA